MRYKDLARHWGVCVDTAREWVKRHKITVYRPSLRHVYVLKRDVDRFDRSNRYRWEDA